MRVTTTRIRAKLKGREILAEETVHVKLAHARSGIDRVG